MNIIDRFVNYFNPTAGLKRVQSRARQKIITDFTRKYEGASSSRRTENWYTTSSDANAEIRDGLIKLRNRSRDLVRNNPWAERVMQLYENNVIGKGIQTQFYSSNTATAEKINQKWLNWTDSLDCDWSENMNYINMQRLAMRMIAESGEALIRIHMLSSKEQEVPLKLELLEPDFINPTPLKPSKKGNVIIDGIEIDERGRRQAYYLFKNHPGSNDLSAIVRGNYESFRLDAKWIVHGYRVNRSGQLRGVPILSPVIIAMREFDEYMDAQIVKQKISACMTAFITDPNGGMDMTEDEQEIASHFEPGTLNVLNPGQSIETVNPPTVEGFRDFTSTTLRSMAIGTGLSYESLSGDLSQVNFSSARMGWLEMARNIDVWREQVMITMVLEPIVKKFVQSLDLTGVKIPRDLNWKYTSPKREMIDPTREIPATIEGIQGGLITLQDAIKQSGNDPEIHLQEIADTNQKLDDLGIILTTDPRQRQNNLRNREENS